MAQSGPPQLSPDGHWYWDGTQWQALVSPDGSHRWNGTAWVPVVAAAPVPAPPPPPVAAESPAWLAPPVPEPEPPPPPPPQIELPPGPISPWIAANYPRVKQTASYSGTFYAGFWIRFLAYFIDSLIFGIPTSILIFVLIVSSFAGQTPTPEELQAKTLPFDLIYLVVTAAYFTYFWSTGATPGMRLFRLRVVDADTQEHIGLGRALLRYVGFLISSFCCDIGLIWAAFDGRKQGWHDKIAGTVVILASGR
jgi:uncharacterized RDD family membrane protein YckC